MSNSNRRTRRLIDRKVQGALVRQVAKHWLLFMLVIFLAAPLWRLTTVGQFESSFSRMLIDGWKEMIPVLVIFLIALPIFLVDIVKLSHRFCGPILRLHSTMRKITDGKECQPIKLRKSDYWQEVADDFNAMVDQLKSNDTSKAKKEEHTGAL